MRYYDPNFIPDNGDWICSTCGRVNTKWVQLCPCKILPRKK